MVDIPDGPCTTCFQRMKLARESPSGSVVSSLARPLRTKEASVMAKRKKNSEELPTSSTDNGPGPADRERIASRAYELFVARGGIDGQDLEDWLTAERELSERQRRGE